MHETLWYTALRSDERRLLIGPVHAIQTYSEYGRWLSISTCGKLSTVPTQGLVWLHWVRAIFTQSNQTSALVSVPTKRPAGSTALHGLDISEGCRRLVGWLLLDVVASGCVAVVECQSQFEFASEFASAHKRGPPLFLYPSSMPPFRNITTLYAVCSAATPPPPTCNLIMTVIM